MSNISMDISGKIDLWESINSREYLITLLKAHIPLSCFAKKATEVYRAEVST